MALVTTSSLMARKASLSGRRVKSAWRRALRSTAPASSTNQPSIRPSVSCALGSHWASAGLIRLLRHG
eukprot:1176553-Prymnesium_polylepis.1